MPTSFDLNAAMFDARDKWGKEKPKKKTLSIYFCVFATQLNNCLLQQAAYFIKGLMNYDINRLFFS